MEKIVVGVRFSRTGEEVINYYLKNKILGKTCLVDEAINEIDICDYHPECLPSMSKLESKDLIWYFFTPREYHATVKKKGTKRTTPSGFWKATGEDRKIKDKRGHGEVIGIKKTLVYHEGKSANGVKTSWVMHEYHITCLPPTQRNYVICQVMYKGADVDSLYGNSSNESNTAPQVEQPPSQDPHGMSLDDLPTPVDEQDDPTQFNPDTLFNDNYCPQQRPEIPWDDEYLSGFQNFNGGNFDDVLGDIDIMMILKEQRNDYRPKKALTGTLPEYSSDSNAESLSATSYQGISSPESAHNLSSHFHATVDEIPSLKRGSGKKSHFTRRITPSKQEVKEGKSTAIDASMDKKSSSSSSPMAKTEKKGWFITEVAMDRRNRKNPRYIYAMNVIIGFIILVAVVRNITSGLLSAKT